MLMSCKHLWKPQSQPAGGKTPLTAENIREVKDRAGGPTAELDFNPALPTLHLLLQRHLLFALPQDTGRPGCHLAPSAQGLSDSSAHIQKVVSSRPLPLPLPAVALRLPSISCSKAGLSRTWSWGLTDPEGLADRLVPLQSSWERVILMGRNPAAASVLASEGLTTFSAGPCSSDALLCGSEYAFPRGSCRSACVGRSFQSMNVFLKKALHTGVGSRKEANQRLWNLT